MYKHRHHKAPLFKEDRILTPANESQEERKLLEFIEEKLEGRSRTDIKALLRNRHIKVGGKVTTSFNHPVAPGEEVEINLSRPFVELRHPRLSLVYEDDHIIVVNKGYGLLSVSTPNSKKGETAYDIVRNYVKLRNPSNKLFVVHRLDRDTTGLMMFAKSEEAQEILRHNWNNMILERLYVALLEGFVKQDEGYVKSRLTENSQYVVYSTDREGEGKLAVTHFKVLKRGYGYSLVEFSLDTGRKNQIRVHASEMGHPISGDKKYGAKKSNKLGRLCLHARTLKFAHPITRKSMSFDTPIPPGFCKVVGYTRKNQEGNPETNAEKEAE